MASLTRPSVASYSVAHRYDAETHDHEDHTFSGVMFTLLCKDELPLEFIEVSSLWVRGELGPMTVWWTDEGWFGKHERRACWTRVFQGTVAPRRAARAAEPRRGRCAPRPARASACTSTRRVPATARRVRQPARGGDARGPDRAAAARARAPLEPAVLELAPVGRVARAPPVRRPRLYRATYLLWNPECHALPGALPPRMRAPLPVPAPRRVAALAHARRRALLHPQHAAARLGRRAAARARRRRAAQPPARRARRACRRRRRRRRARRAPAP